MVKIIGVDFSGAKAGNGTWITEGQLNGGALTITKCCPIKRNDLEARLKVQPGDTVVAMDFPFCVPLSFTQYWQANTTNWQTAPTSMVEVWKEAANMGLQGFKAMCANYSNIMPAGKKHPLRIGDLYSSKPLSCLNIIILPMTFCGMQMLHRLWESESKFRVPPIDDCGRNGPVLLEVMPGAALESFGLPHEHYKEVGKKVSKLEIDENREKILRGLGSKSKIQLTNLANFRGTYLSHHDGLDSLVAAVVAARWKLGESQFRHPTATSADCSKLPDSKRCDRASEEALAMSEEQAAKREGWIYTPP